VVGRSRPACFDRAAAFPRAQFTARHQVYQDTYRGSRAQVWLLDGVTTGDYHGVVKAIGVKELKARLSEYVRLARAGETVLITDRGEVVAELRPSHRQRPGRESLDDVLQELADAGETTRPSLPKANWTWKVKGLGLPEGTARSLLDGVRGDRLNP
jgi:antitoxin (DNA-binding transcriptional repressor) of toxin-antitoxin stability system